MQMGELNIEHGLEKSLMSKEFKKLWAANGNELSIQYSGTGSTTTALTQDGKEGIIGSIQYGFTSFSRFLVNNFEDSFRQKCIDVLLNRSSTIPKSSI